MCSYFSCYLFSLFHNKLVSERGLISERFDLLDNGNIKYDIPLLHRNTKFSLWQVKMWVVLVQMDLDDALLRFDKMSSSWT